MIHEEVDPLKLRNRAFTLIELLVVIAIIAILAAILFPVFAQAKAAAKTAASLSNTKQLGLSMLIYSNDFDDWRCPRSAQGNAYGQLEWKQLIIPYVKSRDIYRDGVNPASKFYDFESDPAFRAFAAGAGWGWTDVPDSMRMVRGYQWANSYNAGGGGFDIGGPFTGFPNPSTIWNLTEDKRPNEDDAAWLGWFQDVDSDISWVTGYPHTGLQWNHKGDKYGDKANVAVFMDGHAKRQSFSQACGNMGPGQLDVFGMDAAAVAGNPGWTNGDWGWAQDSTHHWNFCATLPTQFR